MRRLAPFFALSIAVPLLAQPPSPDNVVLLDKDAVGFAQPIPIAGGVERAFWSPDGRYVLAVRTEFRITPALVKAATTPGAPPMPPPGETSLLLWNRETRATETLWKRPVGLGRVEYIEWLPGAQCAVAVLMEVPKIDPTGETLGRMVVVRLHAPTRALREIAEFLGDTFQRVAVSPTHPLAVVLGVRHIKRKVTRPDGSTAEILSGEYAICFLGERGGLSGYFEAPSGYYVGSEPWDSAGHVRLTPYDTDVGGESPKQREIAMDPRTGRILAASTTAKKPVTSPGISLVVVEQPMGTRPNARTVPSLWFGAEVNGERRAGLLSGDANWGELSPRGDAVLYTSRGVLMAADLVRIPKAAYLAARAAAERATVISNAKQIGLALHMYAQDHNEAFPGASDDVANRIAPYLKNSSMTAGLVYTHSGGAIANIENPDKTELGYLPGSGGRAIIYADGHVQWKAD